MERYRELASVIKMYVEKYEVAKFSPLEMTEEDLDQAHSYLQQMLGSVQQKLRMDAHGSVISSGARIEGASAFLPTKEHVPWYVPPQALGGMGGGGHRGGGAPQGEGGGSGGAAGGERMATQRRRDIGLDVRRGPGGMGLANPSQLGMQGESSIGHRGGHEEEGLGGEGVGQHRRGAFGVDPSMGDDDVDEEEYAGYGDECGYGPRQGDDGGLIRGSLQEWEGGGSYRHRRGKRGEGGDHISLDVAAAGGGDDDVDWGNYI